MVYVCAKCNAEKVVRTGQFSEYQVAPVSLSGAAKGGDPRCHHDFRFEAAELGCGPIPPLAIWSLRASIAALISFGLVVALPK